MVHPLVSQASARLDLVTKRVDGIAPLLARLTVGVVFTQSGFGKLQHLDKVIGFFTELGIPAPQLQAPMVASIELVGGVLVLLGLGTRVFSLLLASTMVVALITAKRADIAGFGDLFGTIEWTYLVLLGWLALTGAGRFSLDRVLRSRIGLPAAMPAVSTVLAQG